MGVNFYLQLSIFLQLFAAGVFFYLITVKNHYRAALALAFGVALYLIHDVLVLYSGFGEFVFFELNVLHVIAAFLIFIGSMWLLPMFNGGRPFFEKVKFDEHHNERLQMTVELAPYSVMFVDVDGKVEYVNKKFIETTGYSAREVMNKPSREFIFGSIEDDTYENYWQSVINEKEWKGEVEKVRKSGELFCEIIKITPIISARHSVTGFVVVLEDITLQKEYETRLIHQSNYDELTNLPNRFLAFDRLQQAISRSQRLHRKVAVMFVDLDQFKYVNDTLGHTAGDQLLIEATQRLRACVRESDTIARLGGDEFAIILTDLQEDAHYEIVAQKIIDQFKVGFKLDNNEVFVTASIGISISPVDGTDPHALLRNADAALYKAKEESRNTFRFFKKEMNESAVMRLTVESHLRNALAKDEFHMVYQPIVELHSGIIHGVEVLLRWMNPELGQVEPDIFIPLAEETGLIVPIGEWILNSACHEVKKLHNKFEIPFVVSINVSSKQIITTDIVHIMEGVIQRTEIDPKYVQLEITERLLMEDTPKTMEVLRKLKNLGIRIALDDFGTGYSSLGYLKKFPFDVLKLDRTFIRGVTTRINDAALAEAIITMAQTLDLEVVAEGVETIKQYDFLKKEKCNMVQGYYVSKPLKIDRLIKYLRDQF